jgi:hypothetical protein
MPGNYRQTFAQCRFIAVSLDFNFNSSDNITKKQQLIKIIEQQKQEISAHGKIVKTVSGMISSSPSKHK